MNKIIDSIMGAFSNSNEKGSVQGLHRRKIKYADAKQKSFILSENASDNLEKILFQSKLVETGQVKLLGLESIKKKLGNDWSVLLENIHDSLIAIIESHITSKDVFFNRSDDEFVIVFASTSDKAAELICAKILKNLTEKFLGSSDTEEIVVKTATKKVNGEVFFRSENLGSMLEAVAYQKSSAIINQSGEEHDQKDGSKLEQYDFGFLPVWDAKHEAITTFLVKPYIGNIYKAALGTAKLKIGYNVLNRFHTNEEKIKLDYMALKHGVTTLKKLDATKYRPVFNIPINYKALCNADLLRHYASLCSIITPDISKYIVFSLIDFPNGIPTVKLNFIVSTLKRFGRAVMLNTTSCDLHLSKYKDCDIKVIVVNLCELASKREIAWEKLQSFIIKCHQNSLRVAIIDVDTLEDLLLAKTRNVEYIAGKAIGEYKDRCGPMQRLPWKHILNSFQDF